MSYIGASGRSQRCQAPSVTVSAPWYSEVATC